MYTSLGQGQEIALTFNTRVSSYIQLEMLGFSLRSPGFDGVGKERTGPFRPHNNKISQNFTMLYGQMALSENLGALR